jgi:uncharacterized protein (TIGR03437 family)
MAAMTPAASAQTPANITIVSGNGQITCPTCSLQGGTIPAFFDGMYVKVTDANGNAVPNAPVTWTVTSGQGALNNSSQTDQTYTSTPQGIATEGYILAPPFGGGSFTNPFVQSSITASIAGGTSVTFYLTQAYSSPSQGSPQLVQVNLQQPPYPGETLTGNAGGTLTETGSTSPVQFEAVVYVQNGSPNVVPNVSLRLVSNQPSPTVSCATGAGADPGSVLTDSTGTATCTPILGSTAGRGSFYVLVGGVASAGYDVGGPPQGYYPSGNFNLNVLPGVASALAILSGNNQSGTPGQALGAPLIATVVDGSGNPLSGQQVVWSVVSPTNGATLSNTTTTSDSNGHVQTNVTLANSASGAVTIKVALVSNPNISATFTATATVQLTGLQFLSSNSTTVLVNSSTPVTVQLTAANGQSSANVPVSFTISGPATLSSSTAVTNSSGQATVNVTAGAVTGAVTIGAAAGGQTATFSMTVIPAGPMLTTGSFYNGADFQQGSISPCSIATIIAPGVAAAIQGVLAYDGVGALPYTLGAAQVTFNGAQAPIYNLANQNGQQQITVQVPCSVTPGNVVVVVTVGGGSSMVTVPVKPASPGLFMTHFTAGAMAIPVLERPDGSFVSPTNPAQPGETLIAFVTGIGPTAPSVATNALPAPGSNPSVQGTIIAGMNGQGVSLVGSTISPDLVGVETVSFIVPSTTPAGNSTFSVGVLYPSSGSTVYYSNVGVFPVQ